MPSPGDSTALLRRHLARELRRLREERVCISLDEAARKLGWTHTALWHMECGDVLPRSRDVAALCALYDAEEHTTACLVAIATHANPRPPSRDTDHAWTPRVYQELREYADRIYEYQSTLVPTLLQTRAYARLQLAESMRDPDTLDRRVSARLDEARLLTRLRPDPPRFHVVLDERVLRQLPHQPDVMAEQRHHLAQLSYLPNISIRIVPFAAGPYPGLLIASGFTVLDFPEHHQQGPDFMPPMSTETGDPDNQGEGQRYLEAFNDLLTQALDEDTSRELLLRPGTSHPTTRVDYRPGR